MIFGFSLSISITIVLIFKRHNIYKIWQITSIIALTLPKTFWVQNILFITFYNALMMCLSVYNLSQNDYYKNFDYITIMACYVNWEHCVLTYFFMFFILIILEIHRKIFKTVNDKFSNNSLDFNTTENLLILHETTSENCKNINESFGFIFLNLMAETVGGVFFLCYYAVIHGMNWIDTLCIIQKIIQTFIFILIISNTQNEVCLYE